eukprot:jgi/Mesen1/10775/ME000091S10295
MAAADVQGLQVEAYKRLYPEEYFARFLVEGVRPDGRPLGRGRATSIGLGAVASADGSALVKIGNTAVLAGVKLEVFVPAPDAPDQGRLVVEFQMPPLCSAQVKPGRPPDVAHSVTQQLTGALSSADLVDLKQLCIVEGQAAWVAYLRMAKVLQPASVWLVLEYGQQDLYCLDDDGALIDAALLASVAALADLQLPGVSVSPEGRVSIPSKLPQPPPQGGGGAAEPEARLETAAGAAAAEDASGGGEGGRSGPPDEADPETGADPGGERAQGAQVRAPRALELGPVPYALTCGLYKGHILADPSTEEEALLESTLTLVLDSRNRLVSSYKPGGRADATVASIQDCLALARIRRREVEAVLQSTLAAAAGEGDSKEGDEGSGHAEPME